MKTNQPQWRLVAATLLQERPLAAIPLRERPIAGSARSYESAA